MFCYYVQSPSLTNLIYSHYRDIMNNKVFYQHPNLMRILGMHETVMEVMVNVLGEGESKVRLYLLYLIRITLEMLNC